MMNAQHYAKVKSIADWLQHLDSNGAWNEMYKDWENMDKESRLTELEYLMSTLTEYIDSEHDPVYLNSFESALVDIRKVEYEILEEL